MLACLGPLVAVLRIAQFDVGCSPACISPTHGFSGSCWRLGRTNMIMNGWLVKCYCLLLLLYHEMHFGWPCCYCFVNNFHPTKYIFLSFAVALHENPAWRKDSCKSPINSIPFASCTHSHSAAQLLFSLTGFLPPFTPRSPLILALCPCHAHFRHSHEIQRH